MVEIRVIKTILRPACQKCGGRADMADIGKNVILCADCCQKIMLLTTSLFEGWRWASQVNFDEPEMVDPE